MANMKIGAFATNALEYFMIFQGMKMVPCRNFYQEYTNKSQIAGNDFGILCNFFLR
ncbi:hypothetical protein PSOL_03110 [Candidatus Phytoplasma solani]